MPKHLKLSAEQEAKIIKELGGTLPKNDYRAQVEAQRAFTLAKSDPQGPDSFSATLANDFRRRRAASNRKLATNSGDMMAALPKFYDPKEYWQISGMPWDVQEELQRKRLYEWLRLFYMTHYLVPILIDIFTRFPLVGIELNSKDKKLTQWYDDLFMDRLDYPEFLVRLGREYWTIGQAFPLASFNDSLGIWEREEIINPNDVVIKNFPILGSQTFEIKPPDYLVELATTQRPPHEYMKLQREWPDLIEYLRKRKNIPVSDILMKQVAFKINDWDLHGTPILLRVLRTLMHEEKLMASQDAIAERLYSPLILAKLGIQDIGDGSPWMPGPDETAAFRDDLDMALSSDFRVLVHHFGVDIQNVFGREQMPRLGDDFDRIEKRIMQAFGVNPSLLSAPSGNAQPYASSALQAEFLNQILRTYQGYLKAHYMERARIVAEANEHYDYEKRGETRVPIMEERVEFDEEGNKQIVQRNKLLIPEMNMKVLDLRDEATQRQFMQQLKQTGIPISDDTFMIGMPTDFPEELEKSQEEAVLKTVAQQEAKIEIYKLCKLKNLPVPQDIMAEVAASGVDPLADIPDDQLPPGVEKGLPGQDMLGPGGAPPPPGGAPEAGGLPGGMAMPPPPEGMPPAAQPMNPQRGGVPEISHERTPISKAASALISRVEKTNDDGEVESIVLELPRASTDPIPLVDKTRE